MMHGSTEGASPFLDETLREKDRAIVVSSGKSYDTDGASSASPCESLRFMTEGTLVKIRASPFFVAGTRRAKS